jgi:hypothetical protein
MLNVKCQKLNVKYQMSNVKYQMPKCQMWNTKFQISVSNLFQFIFIKYACEIKCIMDTFVNYDIWDWFGLFRDWFGIEFEIIEIDNIT